MGTVPTGPAYSLLPQSPWGKLSFKLNTIWHRPALLLFTLIVLEYWCEQFVRLFQVHVLLRPIDQSLGMLGTFWPWLVQSELSHYLVAVSMLIGLWLLRKGFTGRARVWWMLALGIQFWVHIKSALIEYQIIAGHDFLDAPVPIGLIQMLGLIEGPAATGFNGLLTGPPSHPVNALLFVVRGVEVHMIYSTIVIIPLCIGVLFHLFPSRVEEQHMGCRCACNKRLAVPHVSTVGSVV
jgi:hypothetical protein